MTCVGAQLFNVKNTFKRANTKLKNYPKYRY